MKKIRQKEKAYMDNFEKTFSHSDTPNSDCDEEIVTTSDVSLVRESSGKKRRVVHLHLFQTTSCDLNAWCAWQHE